MNTKSTDVSLVHTSKFSLTSFIWPLLFARLHEKILHATNVMWELHSLKNWRASFYCAKEKRYITRESLFVCATRYRKIVVWFRGWQCFPSSSSQEQDGLSSTCVTQNGTHKASFNFFLSFFLPLIYNKKKCRYSTHNSCLSSRKRRHLSELGKASFFSALALLSCVSPLSKFISAHRLHRVRANIFVIKTLPLKICSGGKAFKNRQSLFTSDHAWFAVRHCTCKPQEIQT